MNNTNNPASNLPKVQEFGDLHITNALKAMIKTLTSMAGIYAIVNTVSGKIYIGSSINIGFRMLAHLVYNTTNVHLQNAIAVFNTGLETFKVVVIELFESDPTLSDFGFAGREARRILPNY